MSCHSPSLSSNTEIKHKGRRKKVKNIRNAHEILHQIDPDSIPASLIYVTLRQVESLGPSLPSSFESQ